LFVLTNNKYLHVLFLYYAYAVCEMFTKLMGLTFRTMHDASYSLFCAEGAIYSQFSDFAVSTTKLQLNKLCAK